MATTTYAQEIATTILRQIQASAPNQWAVMAWGISAKVFGVTEDKEKNPFLQLRVNGSKFKGNLRIVYHQCPDVYSIHFYNRKGEEKTELAQEMVYCDELFDRLDSAIEKLWRR